MELTLDVLWPEPTLTADGAWWHPVGIADAGMHGMDATDPRLCEPMGLEYVNRWVPFDRAGYADLEAAVAAGPIIAGGEATA